MKDASGSSSDDDDLQKYASDLLSESLVTGVPLIVKAPNWPTKLFKSCTLFICLAGFLYQTTVFVSYFLTYPSAIDIVVETSEDIVAPAVTICNNNGIERTKFCEKFPERCTVPENETEFCHSYPEICDSKTENETLMIPQEEHHYFEARATLQDFRELSLKRKKFLRVFESGSEITGNRILGPFVLFKRFPLGIVCYTINSCVKNCNETRKMKIASGSGRTRAAKMTIKLTLDKSESFLPGRVAGGWLSLHSPFEVSNPYYKGHFLKPAKKYDVTFETEKKELLPHPYRTNCRNYTDSWLKNGWTGPTSRMVCTELCDLEQTRRSCRNCSSKVLDYPLDANDCFLDWFNCTGGYSQEDFQMCVKDCKDDCLKYDFPYVVEERPLRDYSVEETLSPRQKKRTTVVLHLRSTDTITYRHQPIYQDIEVFSYIGGYVGAWLGISLVAVTDFFESLLAIAVFAFKKRPSKKRRRSLIMRLIKRKEEEGL